MAQQPIELQATARPRAGKGAARQARREGKVPAVIYGDGQAPETIALDYNDLWKQVLKGHFTSTVIEVVVEGKKSRVIPRDLQVDPIKDQPIHVDFMRIGKDGRIRVEVPVRFINDQLSPGLKRGGVLNIVRHDVEVICPYDHIPPFFEVDLTGLEIGRSIHISAVTLPKDAELTIKDRDFTIATIAGAVKQEEETPTAAAAPAEGAAAAPAAAGDAAKAGAAPAMGAAAPAAAKGAPAPAAKAAAPAAKKK
jgi:large subunit ribosomal protein L25